MMAVIKQLKIWWGGALVVLVLVFAVLSAVNGQALSKVKIKLKPGQKDHLDKVLPLVSAKGERLPDYKVEALVDGRWVFLGARVNTSARDWIVFDINDGPCVGLVRAVRISEDDRIEDDLLDIIPMADGEIAGSRFQLQTESRFSFKVGLSWFFSTAVGKAVSLGITLAVVLIFLSLFS